MNSFSTLRISSEKATSKLQKLFFYCLLVLNTNMFILGLFRGLSWVLVLHTIELSWRRPTHFFHEVVWITKPVSDYCSTLTLHLLFPSQENTRFDWFTSERAAMDPTGPSSGNYFFRSCARYGRPQRTCCLYDTRSPQERETTTKSDWFYFFGPARAWRWKGKNIVWFARWIFNRCATKILNKPIVFDCQPSFLFVTSSSIFLVQTVKPRTRLRRFEKLSTYCINNSVCDNSRIKNYCKKLNHQRISKTKILTKNKNFPHEVRLLLYVCVELSSVEWYSGSVLSHCAVVFPSFSSSIGFYFRSR